ncbi:hypothetical protein DXG01_014772, partial [Tephrocybe rancida]
MAHWHGLAKLQLHSALTLDLLNETTTTLGEALRKFKDVICPAFKTRELHCEAAAREHRVASKTMKAKALADLTGSAAAGVPAAPIAPLNQAPRHRDETDAYSARINQAETLVELAVAGAPAAQTAPLNQEAAHGDETNVTVSSTGINQAEMLVEP